MTRTAWLKLAASGLIAAIGFGIPSTALNASDGEQPRANPARANNSAARAVQMLERGRADRAVGFAEEAVAMNPNDAGHRALLGQAYLAVGRFLSAEASFDAARQLGATNARTIVGHSLALVAMNREGEALALLDANASTLPASDYGLALAMAGQAERGAMVLTDVVRSGESTARDRQNLALSYAMAGRWLEARLLAAQDLGAANVGARIEQWTAMVQSGSPAIRVAGLLGTTPAQDAGMPVRFAMVNGRAPGLAMADDPAPLATYAPPPPSNGDAMVETMLANADVPSDAPRAAEVPLPQPVMVAVSDVTPDQAAAPAAPAVNDGALVFVSNPIIQPLRAMVAMVAPLANPAQPRTSSRLGRVSRVAAAPAPVAASVSAPEAAAPSTPRGSVRVSGWAIQLGAYESQAIARSNWSRLAVRHAALARHDGVTTSASVSGRPYHRLVATGFDTRAEAVSVCAAVTRAGGNCFVRNLPATERVQWASRPLNRRVASR
ncbi:MAG: SPOR domain-containing protein [Sphingopyxis sp.]